MWLGPYGIIGNLFVGCVVYADDIVLLSVSRFGLQKLMDMCESYSQGRRHGFESGGVKFCERSE